MNTVTLTDEQAALFILFMKHYDDFGFLVSQGVFDITEGSATMHFGKGGKVLKVTKQTHHFPPHIPNTYPHHIAGQGDNIVVVKV